MSEGVRSRGGRPRLDGLSAWISGAGSGIGRDTARLFAREGAFVAVCDRDAGSAEAVAHEIESGGGRAIAVVADVARSEEVEAALQVAEREGGGPARAFQQRRGVSRGRRFAGGYPEDVWEQVIDINLKGVFPRAASTAYPRCFEPVAGRSSTRRPLWRSWGRRPRRSPTRRARAACWR